jgi:ATP-dependent DNA helicase RecQ
MALRRRQIDEKQIDDERRRIEHARFGRLTMLCEAASCRRQVLLGCFDERSQPCGRCDICRGDVALYDGTVDAQMVLSAVYRTGQRFGAGYLSDVLTGVRSDTILRNGHDQVKTFGVGAAKTKQAWSSVIRQLYAADALATASEEHGGFKLTATGDAILRGQQTVKLRLDPPSAKGGGKSTQKGGKGAASAPEGLDEADLALFQALRRKRLEIAKDEGVAAYVVFADKTLIDMTRRRPLTMPDMAAIHGVGGRKLERYGEAFLAVIQNAG